MTASTAPVSPPKRPLSLALLQADSIFWLYATIALLAAIHISMVTGRSINWDEFWFYSQVQTVARGEFIQPLQTIHTRFFFWLPGLPGNEVDHVLIARVVMLACLAITSLGIFLIAERFSDKRTAMLAVAAYLGAGFVMQHGASFRVDPIVTSLLTAGLAITARTRLTLPAILGLGMVIGLAGMVTIKFVLWAPAFAGLALIRWQDENWDWRYVARWLAAGAVSFGVFGMLYILHGTAAASEEANEIATGILERTSGKMFGFFNSPHLYMAGKGALTALPLVLALALVPSTIARIKATWQRKLAWGLMWFPILTPLFYLNSLPYFYAFILPPVVVTTVITIPIFVKRYGQHVLAGSIAASAAMIWLVDVRGVTLQQHALIDGVHETFEEPVAYIDCCGMIGSFKKVNEFRTEWGVEKYLRTGRPVILEAIQERPVPLLLDNNREFSAAIFGVNQTTFHPEDTEAIRETYVRFWGDIFLAGRVVEADTSMDWQVLVPGTYTVRGTLVVDGTRYADGDLISLERGTVRLSNPFSQDARILWGDNLSPPSHEAPISYWTTW